MSIVQNVSGRGFVDMTATYYCERIAVKSSTKKNIFSRSYKTDHVIVSGRKNFNSTAEKLQKLDFNKEYKHKTNILHCKKWFFICELLVNSLSKLLKYRNFESQNILVTEILHELSKNAIS